MTQVQVQREDAEKEQESGVPTPNEQFSGKKQLISWMGSTIL